VFLMSVRGATAVGQLVVFSSSATMRCTLVVLSKISHLLDRLPYKVIDTPMVMTSGQNLYLVYEQMQTNDIHTQFY